MSDALPAFVARRKPDWDELDRLLLALDQRRIAAAELGHLDRLYRRTTADLAHAQVFYAGTDAHRYLNQLCSRAYTRIYRKRTDRLAEIRSFFAVVYPQTVREELRFIGVAAALLLLGAIVGVTTLLLEPTLADLFVPEGLQRFVARRTLWTDAAVAMPPSEMATMILVNNLVVTVLAFAGGIFFGAGTIYILLSNGASNAAIVAHCFNGGVGPGILVFMSAHGPVELSIICISGGAGLVIGHALLVPGERPRSEVLRERSARAVRLVIGCAPFLAGIGVIEGYVSPGDLLPAPLKIALGASLGAAFWLYLLTTGRQRPTLGARADD